MQLLDCLVDSFGCKLICILSFLSFFRPQRKLKLHELRHFRLQIAVSGYISAIIARVAGELLKSVNPIGNVPIVYRGTFVGGDSPIELNLCTGILITFQEGAERMNLFIIDYWTDTIQEKFKNGSNIKSVTKAERSGKVTISVSGGNFTYLFIGYNYRN